MAIAVAPTKSNGNTGTIRAEGRREESGGGDDIAMTITLRKGEPVIPSTDSPTTSPTGPPKNSCNTEDEVSCRDVCYVERNCGADRFSLCHRVCRLGCCSDSPSTLPKTVDLVPLLTKRSAEIRASMKSAQVKK